MNKILLTVLLALFIGCSTSQKPAGLIGGYFWEQNRRERVEAYILSNNPPSEIADALRSRRILIGMDKEQVKLLFGDPSSINKTVGSWGISEQWVYSLIYVYFDNGLVTSYQN